MNTGLDTAELNHQGCGSNALTKRLAQDRYHLKLLKSVNPCIINGKRIPKTGANLKKHFHNLMILVNGAQLVVVTLTNKATLPMQRKLLCLLDPFPLNSYSKQKNN